MVKRFGPKTRRRRVEEDPAWEKFFEEDEVVGEQRREQLRQELLDAPLASSGLSVRIINTLESRGIVQVKHLLCKSREELLEISNFGDSTLGECLKVLRSLRLERVGIETPTWDPPRQVKKRKKPK